MAVLGSTWCTALAIYSSHVCYISRLTGQHVVSIHSSKSHDPLVAVVGQVSDDGLREGLTRLHKRTAQVVLVLLHLQGVLYLEQGGRERIHREWKVEGKYICNVISLRTYYRFILCTHVLLILWRY